jgi:hypothetical protein
MAATVEREEMTAKLDAAYWRRNRLYLAAVALCGLAVIAVAMRMPAHVHMYSLWTILLFALLCSPFTLKTAAGRLWWGAFAIAIGGSVGAVLMGAYNPLSWLCAVAAGCAYSVGVCLRWRPPAVEL